MKNKNKGFTLVEMVVSFVIIMILASIGVVGVLAYQDYADFKRQNSYAQTLFAAAQAKLTDYSVRGELEKLEDIPAEVLPLNIIVTPAGAHADDTTQGGGAKKGTVYYLTGTRENYEKYLNGEYKGKTDPESQQYQILYNIFDEYLFDKTILKAAIALEYNPVEGLVYGVLYSDKNAAFTYESVKEAGKVNICDRQEDYRSEYLIGYYGVE